MNPAEIIVDSVTAWNNLFDRKKIQSTLYHYTTFDGLLGILSEHSLRATFSETLNDGSEGKYGREIVAKYTASITDAVREALTLPEHFRREPPKAFFVTCFCEEPNLLSMWRSYTAQGGGFCLGFDGPKLADDLKRDNLKTGSYVPRLVKMHYGEDLSGPIAALLESGGHVNAEWVLENMIKHPAFEDEREWRLVAPDPPASMMFFHSGHSQVKPFVKTRCHNERLPLKRLIYGPTLRDDDALVKTLTWMLQRYGYEGVNPEPSGIPYRLS